MKIRLSKCLFIFSNVNQSYSLRNVKNLCQNKYSKLTFQKITLNFELNFNGFVELQKSDIQFEEILLVEEKPSNIIGFKIEIVPNVTKIEENTTTKTEEKSEEKEEVSLDFDEDMEKEKVEEKGDDLEAPEVCDESCKDVETEPVKPKVNL